MDNKYTVIIPTMWRCERLRETLEELEQCDSVGEIILIDNTANEEPITDLSKVKHILEKENTFVSAPWNKGAAMAKHEKLLMLSDDVWFDWNILEALSSNVEIGVGMIGLSKESFEIETQPNISLIPVETRPEAFATAFFIHRSSWVLIPQDIKIWVNDDWQFVMNRRSGRQNYKLQGFGVKGYVSLTVNEVVKNPEIEQIIQNDLQQKIKYGLF